MNRFLLEMFTVVVETRRVTTAAKLLNLTQPAVSQQIKHMEAYFGVPLLERGAHGVVPTPAGEVLYRHAKQILAQFDCLEREIDDLAREDEREVVVGASPTVGNFALPCSVWTFQERFPKARLQVEVGGCEEMVERVLRRAVHLAIIEGPVPEQVRALPGLKVRPIGGDHLLLVAPARGVWGRSRLSLQRLLEAPLVLPGRGMGMQRTFEQALEAHGISLRQLNVRSQLGGLEGMKAAVESHDSVMLITRMSVQKELNRGSLREITPPELKMQIPFHLLCYEEQLSPVALRFVRFIAAPQELETCWS
ncbi:MAG: LysR family transcriptional regulator [Bacillota bacterium]